MGKFKGSVATGETIAGADICIYPNSEEQWAEQDILDYLSQYKLNTGLLMVSRVAGWYANDQPITDKIDVPVTDWYLSEVVRRFIECSDDRRSLSPTETQILVGVHGLHCVPVGGFEGEEAELTILRIAPRIFQYQEPLLKTQFARTLLIYNEAWKDCLRTSFFNIDEAFETTFGLTLSQLLVFGIAHTYKYGMGIIPISNKPRSGSNEERLGITPAAHNAFIQAFSCTYTEFRLKSLEYKSKAPRPEFKQFALNPLVDKPIIKPDFPLPDAPSEHYLLPVPSLLGHKVTNGLFHDFANKYRGKGSKNPFRTAFGHAFEHYVYLLLRRCLKIGEVIPDMSYQTSEGEARTPDIIVRNGRNAVLIEVKVNSMNLVSRSFFMPEAIAKDLTDSLGHGMLQLTKFNSDRLVRPELIAFKDIEEVEYVIVTYDPIYFPNSFLKKQIIHSLQTNDKTVVDGKHYHFMSVDDLESVIAIPNLDLFEFLRAKRKKLDAADMKNYIRQENLIFGNEYLNEVFERFVLQIEEEDKV